MANKNTFQRYKKTSLKTKRSLVRTLDRFTINNKFEYVSMNNIKLNSKNELELDNVSIDLEFYTQADIDKLKKIINMNTNIYDMKSNIIFDAKIADNDISSYKLIYEAIDNLHRKHEYKEALKDILNEYSVYDVSELLKNYNEIIITEKIRNTFRCSPLYAQKIYNQVKNRIRYSYIGLYSVNNEITNKVNVLTPRFLNSYDVLKSDIDYILKREWLFNDSILNELKSRLPKAETVSHYREEYQEEDLVQLMSDYFDITIYKEYIQDNLYDDSIEFLKYCYYEEKYQGTEYTPYEYEFLTEWAIDNFKVSDNAIDYILAHNEMMNEEKEKAEFEEEQKTEDLSQIYNAPIDVETYNDTSIQNEYRKSASSITTQWNGFYDSLINSVISEDGINSEYFIVCHKANNLLAYFKKLEKDKAFLKDGSINESGNGKAYQNLLKKLSAEFEGLVGRKKREKIDRIVSIKKKEWKLLNKAITDNYGFFHALENFDYKGLKFRELQV